MASALFLLIGSVVGLRAEPPAAVNRSSSAFRGPVGIAVSADGLTAITANLRGRSLSFIDLRQRVVISEFALPGEPSDIVRLDQERYAVVDASNSTLLFVSPTDPPSLTDRIPIPPGPATVSVSPDGQRLAVCSLWSRTVSLLSRKENGWSRSDLRLDWSPGISRFSPDGELLVAADAFGGEMCVVNRQGTIVAGATLDAHNLAGIAFTAPDEFLLTHQILHSDSPTTADNIASGRVIENVIRTVRLDRSSEGKLSLRSISLREIGVPSHGAADPAGLVILPDGRRWVALSGVDELAQLNRFNETQRRVAVGDRPVDVDYSRSLNRIVVLNRLGESLTLLDPDTGAVTGEIPLGPMPAPTPRDEGERLFFDAHRSRFGWMSCHSCHPDGHSNGLLADTLGDGLPHAPKRVLSLLGGRDSNPWGWNGQFRSLHEQIHKSGVTTMRGEGFSPREVMDIVSFLHSLDFPPPFLPACDELDSQEIDAGRKVFRQAGCGRCHIPPLTFTSDSVYDVGLSDEHGQRKFNPPSLRGVGYRRTLFHDGRARRLEEVFSVEGHGLDAPLSPDDQAVLIRYLLSL